MSLYRIKQFYWSLTSKLDLDDIEFINIYLNDKEKELFNKLSTYEQKHSVNVAWDVMNECKNSEKKEYLVKVALLHDIGKTVKSLNPIEKSIVVLLDNISKGRIKNYTNFKIIDIYYNHADKGYKILKEIGNYDDRFLYLIKNHHNYSIIEDKDLNILKSCDNKN